MSKIVSIVPMSGIFARFGEGEVYPVPLIALRDDGSVVGLVPCENEFVPVDDIAFDGEFEEYAVFEDDEVVAAIWE